MQVERTLPPTLKLRRTAGALATAVGIRGDESPMPKTATFKIWRTHPEGDGTFQTFHTDITDGMVVLDVVHKIQAEQAPDLAVRWNCKAGKCGSCSAEINGKPRLMCMTRLSQVNLLEPVTVEPMRAFPAIKDLVTDVSWNFRVKKAITKFKPRRADAADGTWRMRQRDIDRVQEFRKCIECFLCQTSATSCASTTNTSASRDPGCSSTPRRRPPRTRRRSTPRAPFASGAATATAAGSSTTARG